MIMRFFLALAVFVGTWILGISCGLGVYHPISVGSHSPSVAFWLSLVFSIIAYGRLND